MVVGREKEGNISVWCGSHMGNASIGQQLHFASSRESDQPLDPLGGDAPFGRIAEDIYWLHSLRPFDRLFLPPNVHPIRR